MNAPCPIRNDAELLLACEAALVGLGTWPDPRIDFDESWIRVELTTVDIITKALSAVVLRTAHDRARAMPDYLAMLSVVIEWLGTEAERQHDTKRAERLMDAREYIRCAWHIIYGSEYRLGEYAE